MITNDDISAFFSSVIGEVKVSLTFLANLSYYHLRSAVRCERFFAQVCFSNETVSHTTGYARAL